MKRGITWPGMWITASAACGQDDGSVGRSDDDQAERAVRPGAGTGGRGRSRAASPPGSSVRGSTPPGPRLLRRDLLGADDPDALGGQERLDVLEEAAVLRLDQPVDPLGDRGQRLGGRQPVGGPACWSPARIRRFRSATRTMKNSSRFELKMDRNFTRSRSGTVGSCASSSTRRLNSSQDSSRLTKTSGPTWCRPGRHSRGGGRRSNHRIAYAPRCQMVSPIGILAIGNSDLTLPSRLYDRARHR